MRLRASPYHLSSTFAGDLWPQLPRCTKDEMHTTRSTISQPLGQFSNVSVRKLIGEGASSQVWEGDWAGTQVAIKVLHQHKANGSFLSEVNIWKQLDHPAVCALLGVCTFAGRPSMILELMAGGSLFNLLHSSDNEAERTVIEPWLRGRVVVEVRAVPTQ